MWNDDLILDISPYVVDLDEERMERAMQEAAEESEEYLYYPSAMNKRPYRETARR